MRKRFLSILEKENKNEALNIINEKDELGNTLLMYAVEYASCDFIEFLLQNGADINNINNEGTNALMMALDNDVRIDIDIVKILIDYGIDINHSIDNGTVLTLICILSSQSNLVRKKLDNLIINNCTQDEYLELLSLLIEKGADINAISKDGYTPLFFCIMISNVKAIKILLENKVDLDIKFQNMNILEISIFFYLGVYNMLSKKDKLFDFNNENLLEIIEIFFEKGLSISEELESICILSNNDNDKAIDNINNEDITIYEKESRISQIKLLLDKNNKEKKDKIIKLLIKYNKNLDFLYRLFKFSCMDNNLEIIKLILERNDFDVNYKDENGFDIAVFAAKSSEIQELLLKKGLKFKERSNENKKEYLDSLELLIKENYEKSISLKSKLTDVSEVLLSRDVEELKILISEYSDFSNINIIDLIVKETILNKENPYSFEFIELILKNGANINWQNKDGNTALILCCKYKNEKFVNLLLTYGADKNKKNNNGSNALNFAFMMGSEEIYNILKNHIEITNNPEKLVKILKNFTIDKPMKYSTHIWDFGTLKYEYKNFKGYMAQVENQWKVIKNDLEKLSPNIYKKVYDFLWETDSNIALGWSSIEGLEKWCNDGNNPFDYKLNDKNFDEIVYQFKNEIEIRKEKDILESIFIQERKKLGKKFKVELNKLKGKAFYTDVEKFKNGLSRIFAEIKNREQYPNVKIEVVEDENEKYLEIYVIHIDSYSKSNPREILIETENGDFAEIKESFQNLCEWSIQNNYEDESYQVNYLKNRNENEIKILEKKPQGFTHILRFYL